MEAARPDDWLYWVAWFDWRPGLELVDRYRFERLLLSVRVSG